MSDATLVQAGPAADAAAPPPAGPSAAAPSPNGYKLVMRFTGSGSEYFRIWIVNLLLTLVTVGLYYPFAKVRRLRYFYGNTQLGGEEFDFHGNPWKMLRGFLLMAGLFGAYGLASNMSPSAGLIALVLVAAKLTELFRASLQFRLANTSWRGLRFHFEGTLPGAYRALWPMMVVGVMYIGAFAFAAPQPGQPPKPNPVALAIGGAGGLLAMVLFPYFWFALKRYQHDHYAIGPVRTALRCGAGSFYGVYLKAFGISLLCVLPMVAVLVGLTMMLGPGRGKQSLALVLALPIVMGVCYLGLAVWVGSFINARLQNLVWNHTRSRELRFTSSLTVGALAKLTLKNWLLIALTLGLYFPFARVARAKLLLEALEVTTRHPPQVLTAALRGMRGDAAGDASADLLGFDVGL
jgi:uncharacterized membrane protein YjgN (DUF898 family)